MSSPSQAAQSIAVRVEKIAAQTPIIDIHTHLYDPAFGELLLWGIDDLLVYHYLVAEAFRYFDIPNRTGFRWITKNEPRRLHNYPDSGSDLYG